MVVEDRIASLESDVSELNVDVKALNTRVSESIAANAKEFGGLRISARCELTLRRVSDHSRPRSNQRSYGCWWRVSDR